MLYNLYRLNEGPLSCLPNGCEHWDLLEERGALVYRHCFTRDEKAEEGVALSKLILGMEPYESLHKDGKGRWRVWRAGPVSCVAYGTPREALEVWAQDKAKADAIMAEKETKDAI